MWRDSPRVAAEGVTLSTPELTCSSSSRWAPLPVPSPARPPAASAKTDGAVGSDHGEEAAREGEDLGDGSPARREAAGEHQQ